ncbi:hypothetical protein ACEPOD_005147, partial [Escherichia coli]
IIPPVLFRGTKHQNFNSPNQQSYYWTPTTYISDLLVVVMKKSTAGISIS